MSSARTRDLHLLCGVLFVTATAATAAEPLWPTRSRLILEDLRGQRIAEQDIPPAALSGDAAAGAGAVGTGRTDGLAWSSAIRAGDETAWSLTLVNRTDRRTGVTVRMAHTLSGTGHTPRFASWQDAPDWPTDGRLVYAYHRPFPGVNPDDFVKLVIPFASIHDAQADRGLSFGTDLDFPVLPLRITAWQAGGRTEIEIERPLVRLEPGAEVTLVHYLARHDGDPVAGLRWLRDRFPDKFTVPPEAMGIQTELTGIPHEKTEAYRQKILAERPGRSALSNLRIMPWWGQHIADEEPFISLFDLKWYYFCAYRANHPEITDMPADDASLDEIVAFIDGLGTSDETIRKIERRMKNVPEIGNPMMWHFDRFKFDDVRGILDWMRDLDMKIVMYWDLSEGWMPWIRARHPDTLLFDEGQSSLWGLTVVDPYPGSSLQEDHLRQLDKVFDTYPQMEGLFIDQTYYDDVVHHKRDDGLSIDAEGRPFTRYVWNLRRHAARLCERTRQRGYPVYFNQPWNNLSMAELCDGYLVEAYPDKPLEAMQFYSLGNRIGNVQVPGMLGTQMAFTHGWMISIHCDRSETPFAMPRRTRARRQGILFPFTRLLRGRQMLLDSGCLALADGFDGGVFTTPEGNILVTMVSMGTDMSVPWAWGEVPVAVTSKRTADVRAAFVLSDLVRGLRRVPFERDGDTIRVRVPRHRSISMVLLAGAGRFLCADEWALAPKTGSARLHLIDLDGNSPDALVPVTLRASHDGERDLLVGTATHGDASIAPTFDAWAHEDVRSVEWVAGSGLEVLAAPPPAAVTWRGSDRDLRYAPSFESLVEAELGTDLPVSVTVVNHTRQDRTVRCEVALGDVAAERRQVAVPAGSRRTLTVPLDADRVGRHALRAKVTDDELEAETAFDVLVIGRTLTDDLLEHVDGATVIADVNASTRPRQAIRVNGVEATTLAGAEIRPCWAKSVRMPMTKKALAAIRTGPNRITVDTGEGRFAVANVRLEVVADDGRIVRLGSHDPVQSTPPDWPQAEGRRVPSGGEMEFVVGR